MKSDVYFIKVESLDIEQRLGALKCLFERIKPFSMFHQDEFIPVKITIGDSACVYNIHPDLARWVVKEIKDRQAKPFLFDTSVIYHGQRSNAVDHLDLAQYKGFGHSKIGAPFIVADGVFGQDGREFEIKEKDINKIKIPSFVGMLDSLVVLSHATGHIVSGYAGAIKNVAMGMSCRPTKQVQHSSLKPSVIEDKCTTCGCCIKICPVNAIAFKNKKAFIDQRVCIGCGECLCTCKFDAIYINWHEEPRVFCKRMAKVAAFILSKFKNKFFINFAFDITKECDCISNKNEDMISANLGILASSDILSLDKATADLAGRNKKGNFLEESKSVYEGLFEYSSQIGIGNLNYNLIEIGINI